jgi:GNAT superfamily N-acetyltransferase
MDLRIDRLTPDHVDAATRLSTSVGWNQTPADWRRLLDLYPATCFGGWVDDSLVATSTLATYDDRVGWVGMVLVDEQFRSRGFGSAIFEAALDAGRTAGLETIGLDATDAGRNIYDGYGFETLGGIDRWRGAPAATPSANVHEFAETSEVASFDEARCGVDRTPLLAHLLDSPDTVGLRHTDEGETDGYLVVRPGRTCAQVGPVVADSAAVLGDLLGAVGARIDAPVFLDALRAEWIADVLRSAGLDCRRRLYRMTHEGRTPALYGDGVVAATGFEWG